MYESWLEPLKTYRVQPLRTVAQGDLPDPPRPLSLGQLIQQLPDARLIKRAHNTCVILIPASADGWPGAVLKVERFEGLIAKFKARAWSHLQREFGNLVLAARRELPTPRPYVLLSGSDHEATYHYLVMEALDATAKLESWLAREGAAICRRREWRAQFALQLGNFMAQLHNGTLYHSDLHLENILVPDDAVAGDRLRLWLVDLAYALFVRTPSFDQLVENLAQLNLGFFLRSSRVDRMRFFRTYCLSRELSGGLSRRLMTQVEEHTRKLQFTLNTERITRSMEQTPRVQYFSGDSWQVAIALQAGAMKWHELESRLRRTESSPYAALRRYIQQRVPPDRLQEVRVPLNQEDAPSARRIEVLVRILWGGQLELYANRVPTGEPLCCYADGKEILIYNRYSGIRKPFLETYCRAETTSRAGIRLLERLGHLLAKMFSLGVFFLQGNDSELFDRLGVLTAYEDPEPQPVISAVDHLYRKFPGDPEATQQSLVSWLGAMEGVFNRAAIGHFLRSYLRAGRLGTGREQLKLEVRRLLAATRRKEPAGAEASGGTRVYIAPEGRG